MQRLQCCIDNQARSSKQDKEQCSITQDLQFTMKTEQL